MDLPKKRQARKIAVLLATLALVIWLAPGFFSAEHSRHRLQAALEQALGRPVTFEDISFHILPRPGFTIANTVVGEIPRFGPEPFVRAERVDCDLRWHSLWRTHLDISRISLDHASLNLVRDGSGEWNFEELLLPKAAGSPRSAGEKLAEAPAGLDMVADDARVNFKIGEDKKPFVITDLTARIHFSPRSQQVSFHFTGNPVRTDIPFPTPGPVEMEGEWTPRGSPGGKLRATLQTHGALLYDWVPLVSGRDPGIYGILDAQIHLTGSLRKIDFQGSGRLAQLHRWEELPPSSAMPSDLRFRGSFDRDRGQVSISGIDVTFAGSQMHVAGAIDNLTSTNDLDLVVAVERSRLEDLLEMARRLSGRRGDWGITGRVNGMVAVRGRWAKPLYGGFLTARDVRLRTPSGTFPVSEVAVRIDRHGARLAPTRFLLAPHVEVVAEGALRFGFSTRQNEITANRARYELALSAHAVPLHDLFRFARGIGFKSVRNLDAEGMVSAGVRFSGKAWPFTRPDVMANADFRSARLLLPGLTEPINFPRVRVEIKNSHIIADPIVAVMGTSVFSGRLEHQGPRDEVWKFSARASRLNLGQGARWFDIFGEQQPVPLLQRLPGVRSLLERREAASSIFGRLNAQGRFSTPSISYRGLTLHGFQAAVAIHERAIRLSKVTFLAGGGRGAGDAVVDLDQKPARLDADVSLMGARIEAIAPVLSPALAEARGHYSARGHFETRGLTRSEIVANLRGAGTVRLGNISLGSFDPLGALARFSGEGSIEPSGQPNIITEGAVRFEILNRRVTTDDASIVLGGASLKLAGAYAFDGKTRLSVQADLRHLQRSWPPAGAGSPVHTRLAKLHFAGTLARLVKVPESAFSSSER